MSKEISATENLSSTMTFIEHLKELRRCLFNSAIGIAVTTTLCLYWSEKIFSFIVSPIRNSFQNLELIGTGPAEAFIIKLEVSMIAGIILSSPNLFLQLWLFISPGLYSKEKKIIIPFVLISSFLFISGTYFCYNVMFPYAFKYFFDEYQSIGITPNIKIDEYLSFVIRMLIVFGVVFELPILSFFLAKIGVLSHKWLLSNFRYMVVGIFIIAGVLTPPDVVSQMLLALPLCVIYALCIIICYMFHPKQAHPIP